MGRDDGPGRGVHSDGRPGPSSGGGPGRPTFNSDVRRRRADRAFYLRLAGAIRQQQRALERLRQ